MSGDSASAAADLADALDDFAEQAATPDAERDVWVTIGTPHDVEQRTIQISTEIADWVTELLRAELDVLTKGLRSGGGDRDDEETGPEIDQWWD
ncbi:hypothetical protein [Kitasatospora sp. NPDC050543]|uniref:hypothetical protein n=1 Tax=Kitasatospora sp. NPDC050543 TaxID=3364054 RepID=UPI00379D9391